MPRPTEPPSNGLLSGMILTGLAIGAVVPIGLADPAFIRRFHEPLDAPMQHWLLATVLLMALHKLESYWRREYDHCPVYLTSARAPWARNTRQAIFVSFVSTFLGLLVILFLALSGPPWPMLLLVAWIAQGLHEWHHLAKSFARRQAYPGVITSVVFTATVSAGLFPAWHDHVFSARGTVFAGYYALLPVILAAFYVEDRWWIRRMSYRGLAQSVM